MAPGDPARVRDQHAPQEPAAQLRARQRLQAKEPVKVLAPLNRPATAMISRLADQNLAKAGQLPSEQNTGASQSRGLTPSSLGVPT